MEDERFPKYAYDLVDWLDANINSPEFPNSANGFANLDSPTIRSAAFTSGARSIVDMLLMWRQEEIEDAETINAEIGTEGIPGETEGAFPRVFDADGSVRGVISPPRMAEVGTGRELDD